MKKGKMKRPKFGRWLIGDPKGKGFDHPTHISGWKFVDFDGVVGIFDSKASALAANKSLKAWEKHCGY